MCLRGLAAALALGLALLACMQAPARESAGGEDPDGKAFVAGAGRREVLPASAPMPANPAFPVEGARIALPYGFENGEYRDWTGLEAGAGSPVRSILPGRVVGVGPGSVTVAGSGVEVAYSGLLPTVQEGDSVGSGQPLGTAIGGLLAVRAAKGGVPYDMIGALFPGRTPLAAEAARVEAERKALAEELARRAKARKEALAAKAAHSAEPNSTSGGGRYSAAYVDRLLVDAARRHGLDPDLVRAVARVESGLNPRAVSPKGAMGLMQLMPETAAEVGVSDPFDPRQSAEGGAEYLRRMLERFGGDLDLALAAYNAGPAAVEEHGGVPPYAETRAYVESVKAEYVRLKGGAKRGASGR